MTTDSTTLTVTTGDATILTVTATAVTVTHQGLVTFAGDLNITTSVASDTLWDAAGDLAVGSGANTAARLAVGNEGDVLSVVSGAVAWAAPTGGGGGSGSVATDTLWDAAGDLAIGTGANTAARLAKGSSGTFLKAGASTVSWAALAAADVSDFAETVRDTMGSALVAGNNIDITPDDNADTITIAVEALTTADISGLGGAATLDVGTTTGTVAAGDDSRITNAVDKTVLDANTILYATTDNTPAALAVAASRIVGRKATGDIVALTGAEAAAILGTTSVDPQSGALVFALSAYNGGW